MNRMRETWLGITYPRFLGNRACYWLWEKWMCPRGYHLFDELQSLDEHHLICDACELTIFIDPGEPNG